MSSTELSPFMEKINQIKVDFKKWTADLRSFWTTYRAILKGERLWDMEEETRRTFNYIGPWRFNFIQTIAAGMVGGTVNKIHSFLTGIYPSPKNLIGENPLLNSILNSIVEFTMPFAFPFYLLIFVTIIGWSMAKGKGAPSSARTRSRVAYLYLDGAHGLWSQMLIASIFPAFLKIMAYEWNHILNFLPTEAERWNSKIFLGLIPLILILGVWQLYITAVKIPRVLFRVAGYTTRFRVIFRPPRSTDPPWIKFWLVGLICSPFLFIGTQLLILLIDLMIASAAIWLLNAARNQ